MFKYHYTCDACGQEVTGGGAPPESVHSPEGPYQACPQCARAEERRQKFINQEKNPMPPAANPQSSDALRAAAARLEQIEARKAARLAEPNPAEDPNEVYEDEEEAVPPPPLRRPARQPVRRAAPRRRTLSDAMDRLEAAIDALDAAEAEFLEAQEEYEVMQEQMEERRARFASRYQPEPPVRTRDRKPVTKARAGSRR